MNLQQIIADNKTLPYVCPSHPDAMIQHTWDQTHYIMNGYPAGTGISSNHRYECAVCGMELAPENVTVRKAKGGGE